MPQACSICVHADRAAIEAAHVEGKSLRAIATQFTGVSAWSLRRHFAHLPAIIEKVTAHDLAQNRTSAKLPARVEELIAEAKAITTTARRKRDYAGALSAIRTRLQCLEMLGKLSGELRPGGPLGEFVPGVAGAAAQASASVTLNVPAPANKRTWGDLEDLIRQIYSLGPRREPSKDPPVM
jgi:hypothetical protein